MHVGPRNIALFSALNMSASAMNNNNLVKVEDSVCSDNNCTQPRAKNQIRCKDCRNQFQAFRSSVVRFYRNDACVPPSDSSCFRRFVEEKLQWVSRLSIVSCIIFIGEYLLSVFFSMVNITRRHVVFVNVATR